MAMSEIALIAHNVRSCYNVGSLLRTAEGLGISYVYLTGYTPYPIMANDARLPHIAAKVDRQIRKAALGAERLQAWEYTENIFPLIDTLKRHQFEIVALEQAANALPLVDYRSGGKTAVIVGREVEGIEPAVIKAADVVLEIPMVGKKESFNVAEAATMAMYQLCFLN